MITKKERTEIFEDTISGLRKKFIPSERKVDVKILDRLAEKFRRLPLD
ncbi:MULTISPECIES: hypothetical protein [Nitrosopumilus]|uniref:Uncharacterized protein n=1 Tax=Nitrosopumilus piranensis TaxID=1582439 RepID=A0A0C5BU03_9ARCH|nr:MULTISPECIES: hypothetical protein [Nitrosopumilus]AJM93238.1 hypothetical protein NPIRD3C_2028 [Nitrosopumilus piranensis]